MDGIIADCMRIIATSTLDYKYPKCFDERINGGNNIFPTYFFARRTLGFFLVGVAIENGVTCMTSLCLDMKIVTHD